MLLGIGAGTGRLLNGVRVFDHLAAWEISLVTPPHRPARVGAWVRPNMEARRDRSRLLRLG